MFARPLTGSVSPAAVSLVMFGMPIHAEEHLIQGWESIKSALAAANERDYDREKAQIAYAHNRLSCARSAAVARGVKPRKRSAYEAECASLEAALKSYTL